MKTFLFHNSQWMASKAEELPVKPTINSLFKEGTSLAAENRRYNQAIADLKDTALPVLNPEILKGVSLETCPIVETSIPVLEWPGTAEKIKKSHVTDSGSAMYKMFYELHLPNQTMKSKIAQRIQDETPKEVKDSVREYADWIVKEKERIEKEAEAYADSIDRRGCSFWSGLKMGYMAGKVELERMAALREALKDHEEVLKECRAYLDNSLNDMRENGKSTTSWSVRYARDLFDKCEAAIEKARNLFKP